MAADPLDALLIGDLKMIAINNTVTKAQLIQTFWDLDPEKYKRLRAVATKEKIQAVFEAKAMTWATQLLAKHGLSIRTE